MRLDNSHSSLLTALSDRSVALIQQMQRSYPDSALRLTVETPGVSLSLIAPPSQSHTSTPQNHRSSPPSSRPIHSASQNQSPHPHKQHTQFLITSHQPQSLQPHHPHNPHSITSPLQANNQYPQSALQKLVSILPPTLTADIARRGTSIMLESRQLGTLAAVFTRLGHLPPSFFLAYATVNSAAWAVKSRSPSVLAATALAISKLLQPSSGTGPEAGLGPTGQAWRHSVDDQEMQQLSRERGLFRDVLAAALSKVRATFSSNRPGQPCLFASSGFKQ